MGGMMIKVHEQLSNQVKLPVLFDNARPRGTIVSTIEGPWISSVAFPVKVPPPCLSLENYLALAVRQG